jgi:DNA invertase Pin-like site-specific DNA recombinase
MGNLPSYDDVADEESSYKKLDLDIIELWEKGYTASEIAINMNLAPSTVYKVLNNYVLDRKLRRYTPDSWVD